MPRGSIWRSRCSPAAADRTSRRALRRSGELLDLQPKQLAYPTRIDDLLRGTAAGPGPRVAAVGRWRDRARHADLGSRRRARLLVATGDRLPVPATPGYATVQRERPRLARLHAGPGHARAAGRAGAGRAARRSPPTPRCARYRCRSSCSCRSFGRADLFAVGRTGARLYAMSRAVAKRRPDALAPLAERACLRSAAARAELERSVGAPDAATLRAAPLSRPRLRTNCARHWLPCSCSFDVARRANLMIAATAPPPTTILMPASRARRTWSSNLVDARRGSNPRCSRPVPPNAILSRWPRKRSLPAAGWRRGKASTLGLHAKARCTCAAMRQICRRWADEPADNALPALRLCRGRVDVAVDDEGGRLCSGVGHRSRHSSGRTRTRVRSLLSRRRQQRAGQRVWASIVKRIADAHQAAISLSDPEHGSGSGRNRPLSALRRLVS